MGIISLFILLDAVFFKIGIKKMNYIVLSPHLLALTGSLVYSLLGLTVESLFSLVIITNFVLLRIMLLKPAKKIKIVVILVMLLVANIFYINFFPRYTYQQASNFINDKLSARFQNVDTIKVTSLMKNYYISEEYYSIFKYRYYVIGQHADGQNLFFIFNPYTGWYKMIPQSSIDKLNNFLE